MQSFSRATTASAPSGFISKTWTGQMSTQSEQPRQPTSAISILGIGYLLASRMISPPRRTTTSSFISPSRCVAQERQGS